MWDIRANKHAVVARKGPRRIVLRHQELLVVDFAAQGRRLARCYASPFLALLRMLDPATCEEIWAAYDTPERSGDGQ